MVFPTIEEQHGAGEAEFVQRLPARERWRHFFRIVSEWWLSGEWFIAWALLLAMLALSLGGVYVAVWQNDWQRQFFDSVSERQTGAFIGLLVAFGAIMASQIATIVMNGFVSRMLHIRWRTYLTHKYLDRWLAGDRYYEIERLRLIDNPDQRIHVDLDGFAAGIPGLFIGFISTFVSAGSFIFILLQTAQPIQFALFGYQIAIPGDTVVYAVAYVVVGSVIITYVGRPYVRRMQRQQHYEADFRANLIHVRRNAEQIAFTQGRHVESLSLRENFERVRHNFVRLIFANIGLSTGQSIYERLSSFLPLFLLVPRYFAERISFGDVMAGRDAFGTVVGNLSYFVQAYPLIGAQIANFNRIHGLDHAIDHSRERGIAFLPGGTTNGAALSAQGLTLLRPNGATLLEVGDWTIDRGERWVITGPSGEGKTTLLRAVAGLWPDGAGSIAISGDTTAMFVPQRLYLPLSTLKGAVCYPDAADRHEDAEIIRLLGDVGLSAHLGALNEERMWQEELSPGEQQRVALARILLHRPDFLIMDEATSALDEQNAQNFFNTLLEQLPGLTLVSVIHDERLKPFHTRSLTIADGKAHFGAIS